MRLYQRLTNGRAVGPVPPLTVGVSAMRTILFDLDGTLVDSAAPVVGPPFEAALPPIGLTAEQTKAAIPHYRSTYDAGASQSFSCAELRR
jgi:phosphoserine phosphatase